MHPWDSSKTESLVRGGLIAAGGAGLTALATYVGGLDLGLYGPVVVAVLSSLINAMRLLAKPPDAPPEAAKEVEPK